MGHFGIIINENKKGCQSFYLEHKRRVQHVLRCKIEAFIQILVSKLFEQLDVVQAISDGGHFLQANI